MSGDEAITCKIARGSRALLAGRSTHTFACIILKIIARLRNLRICDQHF